MLLSKTLVVLCSSTLSLCVTIYGQLPLGQTLSTGSWATTTARAAYNTTRLNLPPQPQGNFTRNFVVQLQRGASQVQDISIPHVGPSFWGFSIEMSVINQVLGKNSSFLNVPFLNLLANLQERAGGVYIRLGGNTQEYAIFVPEGDPRLHPGTNYGKQNSTSIGSTGTPSVLYTLEMFYSCSNISTLLNNNVKWFMGIPFNDPENWRLDIAEHAQAILGDNLLGLQAGNEPDFYELFGRRPVGYTPQDYKEEMGRLIQALEENDRIPQKRMLIGPSTSGQNPNFNSKNVFATGWLDEYDEYLYAITVEHYAHDNCVAMYGADKTGAKDPQALMPYYLNHENVVTLIQPYYETAQIAVQHQKPFIMFETNTGSCGGFPGISNTYIAAIWGLDYGLQMARSNFTHALLHVGGQNVFYNPFTSPQTEQAGFNRWTVGPIFYSALILAEALGTSDTSQVVDLLPNERNPNTPAYAIYEQGSISKVALFNYLSDTSGASDLSVGLTIDGGVPPSVKIKYLLAASVVEKDGITWAGQTFGNQYEADGRLRGDLNISTVTCDRGQNICRIPVPAPGFALVFFNNDAEGVSVSQASQTFATTTHIKPFNTVTLNQELLATSNGHKNAQNNLNYAGTNFEFKRYGSGADGRGRTSAQAMAILVAVALGGILAGI